MASRAERRLRLLALVPDAFGDPLGRLGGIALYNRDLLTAACEHPRVEKVVALPRLILAEGEPLPPKLDYVRRAAGGKARFARAALREAVRGRFDLVLCTHLNLLPVAWAARVGRRAPLVLFTYGMEAWQPTRSRLANALVRRIDGLVCMRPLTRARLHAWAGPLRAREFQLDNALHLERYGAGAKDATLLDRYGLRGRRVLLTVARLEERYKGIDETLEALPLLAADVPEVAYLVVGSGPDQPRLAEKARALGVGDRVVFAGPVTEADKPAHLRLGDAFVMPGTGPDFDRYPLRYVFLEALACGVPVVAPAPDGPGEDAGPAARLLVQVDPRDRESIVAGVKEGLRRPRPRPADVEPFSYDGFRRRVHQILETMCT